MRVRLRDLRPNPMRDFRIDPIEQSAVDELRKSIADHGFWGGIICRQKADGTIEIGAGHHRVMAAIEAGIEEADVCVAPESEMDDCTILQVYSRENATQRGNTATARNGSIGGAIRYIAHLALAANLPNLNPVDFNRIEHRDNGRFTEKEIQKIRGRLVSAKGDGIGREHILLALKDVPGINPNSIRQSLANLKESGAYGRIIADAQAQVERDQAEAIAAMERAEQERQEAEKRAQEAAEARRKAEAEAKAAREEADRKRAQEELESRQREEQEAKQKEEEAKQKAAEHAQTRANLNTGRAASERAQTKDPTFDLDGVSHYILNSHHMEVFRKTVTGPAVKPYLPVANQAMVAKAVVQKAQDKDVELTGHVIKEYVQTWVLDERQKAKEINERERRRLEQEKFQRVVERRQNELCDKLRRIVSVCVLIADDYDRWKQKAPGQKFPASPQVQQTLGDAVQVLTRLYKRITDGRKPEAGSTHPDQPGPSQRGRRQLESGGTA